MKIKNLTTTHVRLPLVKPFQTSFGRFEKKNALIVRVETEKNVIGWGETASLGAPLYSPDFTASDEIVQNQFIFPYLLGREGEDITDFLDVFKPIRGHPFAKAGVEMALWDALAKEAGQPLWKYLGGVRERVPSGISIGIKPSRDDLLQTVESALNEGYQRIKIKIKPGWDVEPVRAIREAFGYDIPLMVDANSAYTLKDLDLLQQLDEFGLLMIEQPLSHTDIYKHEKVQRQLRTPICLDESIHSLDDAKFAVEYGSCRIINIKPGRVGGLYPSKQIHGYCYNHEDTSFTRNGIGRVPLWVGGMLETGVGRAHNLALATLPGFTITGDISPSDRYWREDLTTQPILMNEGYIKLPSGPGIGYDVDMEKMEKYMVR